MKAVVFAGPTLRTVQQDTAFNWRAPATRGDIYRAVAEGASIVCLVDGCFRSVPSVLHKEILWALHRGCAVFGAASIGALRAAELYPFGMIGVGAIFRDFASGRLTRDDEVAIEHGPAELNFPPLSEALVNIRYTLTRAVTNGRISEEASAELIEIAAQTFFARRNLINCINAYNGCHYDDPIPEETIQWILQNRVDQKMDDGLELLAIVRRFLEHEEIPKVPAFEFQDTAFFSDFCAAMTNSIVRDFS
jgi:hypothetical protein